MALLLMMYPALKYSESIIFRLISFFIFIILLVSIVKLTVVAINNKEKYERLI